MPLPGASPIKCCPLSRSSLGLSANITYFYHTAGAGIYFRFCHRNDSFRARWQAATGSWDDKIIGDIGCGPGNVFATVGGNPRLLIGVDVARGSLEMARARWLPHAAIF